MPTAFGLAIGVPFPSGEYTAPAPPPDPEEGSYFGGRYFGRRYFGKRYWG